MNCFLTIVTVLLVWASTNSVVASGEEEDAMARFTRGTELYAQESFTEAAEAFREAHRLKPSWRLLYNIGQAEASARRLGLALDAFEQYLAEGGDEVPSERRDSVLEEIDRLRRIVGSVELVAPDGLEVWVDGHPRGVTPLSGRLRVSATVEHLVELRREDVVLDSRRVSVAGQDMVELRMGNDSSFVAQTTAAHKPLTPEQRRVRKLQRQARVMTIIGSVSLGLGALLTGSGVFMLVDGDVENGAGALVLGGGGMVAGGVLLGVGGKKRKRVRSETSTLTLSPVWTGTAGGVVLTGRF